MSRELIRIAAQPHTHLAFIRALNVTGTGIIKKAELCALAERAGLKNVRTYIQSGNVVGTSSRNAAAVKKAIERELHAYFDKPYRVLIRSLAELQAIEQANPFPEAEPNKVLVVLLDDAPPKAALKDWKIPGKERMHLRGREIFVHFPDGQGRSKLKIPFLDVGTGRNLNTVRAMIALAIFPE